MKKPFMDRVATAVRDCLGLKAEDNQKVLDALNKVKDDDDPNRVMYTDEALSAKFKEFDDKHRAHDARHAAHDDKHRSHDTRLSAHDDRHRAHDARLDALEKEVGEPTKEPDTAHQVEGELEVEAPTGTGDKARMAKDSAYLVDSFQETLSLAEIISPGIKVPTLDKAAAPKKTFLDITRLRQDAIRAAIRDAQTNEFVKQLRGRPLTETEVTNLSLAQTRDLFRGIAALKKEANRGQVKPADQSVAQGFQANAKSLSDINKRNEAFYRN